MLLCNIQRFSVHDGPGIRTTFFLKGCPLRCRWCHNPESQSFLPESLVNAEGRTEQSGREYTVAQLIREAEKDRIFYEQSGGGVTLSGGEPLARDMDEVAGLLLACRRRGISTIVDTCGAVPRENILAALPYTDLFLYDIKALDSRKHMEYTGQSNTVILENLIALSRGGACVNLRLPLLRGVNDTVADMVALARWIGENGVRLQSINLLPYHEFGGQKYVGLGRDWERFEPPDSETLGRHLAFWENLGYPATIGGADRR